MTRQDRHSKPEGGWRPDQRVTIEEAIRGWTAWAAYAMFTEADAGILAPARRADLTVLDIDPFVTGEKYPQQLLAGRVNLTMIDGRIIYESRESGTTTRK